MDTTFAHHGSPKILGRTLEFDRSDLDVTTFDYCWRMGSWIFLASVERIYLIGYSFVGSGRLIGIFDRSASSVYGFRSVASHASGVEHSFFSFGSCGHGVWGDRTSVDRGAMGGSAFDTGRSFCFSLSHFCGRPLCQRYDRRRRAWHRRRIDFDHGIFMTTFPHPPSSESSHLSELGKSFSEAVFDTASVHDLVPEKYHKHLDRLRRGILAFCQEFEIPNEALKDLKAFEFQLTSKKIPAERMAEAVLFFQQLEHLVTHGEPFKEILPEYLQEIEQRYHLTEQYTAQFDLLTEAGILNERNAIIGIDGKEYPLPTLEQIAVRLYERQEELQTKNDQGFVKLLLVPFGMSLDALREAFKQFLLSYTQTHSAFDLDTNNSFLKRDYKGEKMEDFSKLVYYPKFFDPQKHQGQTKMEILKEQGANPEASFPGWTVHLFQPSNIRELDQCSPKGVASIPREFAGSNHGKDLRRSDIVANKTFNKYLSVLQQAQGNEGSPHFLESGLTPEDWMIAFMAHLEETGERLDHYGNNQGSVSGLIGSFFPFSNSVPCMYWRWFNPQVCLDRHNPDFSSGDMGARTSVIV